jgi:lipid A 3-O-deacylase
MMRLRLGLALVAALGIFDAAVSARACTDVGAPGAACDDTATTNLIEENDSFIDHHDLHYTQGLRLSFASSEQTPGDAAYRALRAVADKVFLSDRLEGELRYGLFIGQSLFTPQDLTRTVPDPRDRPYAGWLYGGVSVYRDTGDQLDRADLTLGLVGPGAEGAAVQNNWHREAPLPALRGMHANGWGAQLRDEPGLILSEQRQWRLSTAAGPLELDALPELNASIGNIFTYAAAGGLLRIGQGLGIDWGQPRIEPALSGSDFVNRSAIGGSWGAWYLFGGIEGRAIARNIFLDGNSFEHSAHVTKRPFVADFTGGLMTYLWAARLSVSYTRRTREFSTQLKQDEFVSVLLAVNF